MYVRGNLSLVCRDLLGTDMETESVSHFGGNRHRGDSPKDSTRVARSRRCQQNSLLCAGEDQAQFITTDTIPSVDGCGGPVGPATAGHTTLSSGCSPRCISDPVRNPTAATVPTTPCSHFPVLSPPCQGARERPTSRPRSPELSHRPVLYCRAAPFDRDSTHLRDIIRENERRCRSKKRGTIFS